MSVWMVWLFRRVTMMCGCAVLLVAAAQGATPLEEGKVAYDTGDYKTAIEKWQALIDDGRAEGLFFMGVMHAEGKGVEQDHAKASQFYSEAAEKNYVPAQYNLGNQYANGEGVAQDFSRAEFWWKKAAESGLMHAQVNLGNMYYYGAGGEKKPDLAKKWLTLADQQGSPNAKETLARLAADEVQTPRAMAAPAPGVSGATGAAAQRREAWLLAQPANHFTIQVLAAATDTAVRDYIRQHDLSAHAAYVESAAQGNSVFRVVYGNYASRELADKALAALPRTMSGSSPWVRAFAELHKLVDRRHADRGSR